MKKLVINEKRLVTPGVHHFMVQVVAVHQLVVLGSVKHRMKVIGGLRANSDSSLDIFYRLNAIDGQRRNEVSIVVLKIMISRTSNAKS